MSSRSATMARSKGARLDIDDMERRIVEFRLTLDREYRRCRQAQMMDKFEKLIRDKLNENRVADGTQSATNKDNTIRLDTLDNEGFGRLAIFLRDTIKLCNRFDQHEQFQSVLRQTLQDARRQIYETASRQPASFSELRSVLEPFCLFCGVDPNVKCLSCNTRAFATNVPPTTQIGLSANGEPMDCDLNVQGSGQSSSVDQHIQMAAIGPAPESVATPPPSNANTPDPLNESYSQLREQFRPLAKRSSSGNQQHQSTSFSANASVEPSHTPPTMSPKSIERFHEQQRREIARAIGVLANSQQVNSTTSQQDLAPLAAPSIESNASTIPVSVTFAPVSVSQAKVVDPTSSNGSRPSYTAARMFASNSSGGASSSDNDDEDERLPEDDAVLRILERTQVDEGRLICQRQMKEMEKMIGAKEKKNLASAIQRAVKSTAALVPASDSEDTDEERRSSTPLDSRLQIDEDYQASPVVPAAAATTTSTLTSAANATVGKVMALRRHKLQAKSPKMTVEAASVTVMSSSATSKPTRSTSPPLSAGASHLKSQQARQQGPKNDPKNGSLKQQGDHSLSTSQLEAARRRLSQKKGVRTKHQPKRRY